MNVEQQATGSAPELLLHCYYEQLADVSSTPVAWPMANEQFNFYNFINNNIWWQHVKTQEL